MTIKVGPKGRHLDIPSGYRRVLPPEKMREGDLHADIYTLNFDHIDREDIGAEPWQECVIRRIKE